MSSCPPTLPAEHMFSVIPTLASLRSASRRLRTSGGTGSFLAITTRPCKPIPRLHRMPYSTPLPPTCRASAASTSRQPNRRTTMVVRQHVWRQNEPRRLGQFERARDLTSPSFNRSWMVCGECEFDH